MEDYRVKNKIDMKEVKFFCNLFGVEVEEKLDFYASQPYFPLGNLSINSVRTLTFEFPSNFGLKSKEVFLKIIEHFDREA